MANIFLSFNSLGRRRGSILGKYEWITTSPNANTDLVAMGIAPNCSLQIGG